MLWFYFFIIFFYLFFDFDVFLIFFLPFDSSLLGLNSVTKFELLIFYCSNKRETAHAE